MYIHFLLDIYKYISISISNIFFSFTLQQMMYKYIYINYIIKINCPEFLVKFLKYKEKD